MEVNVKEKNERLQIALTKGEKDRLQELADANTGTNMSLLIRRMLEKAWREPEAFELYPPKEEALVSMN